MFLSIDMTEREIPRGDANPDFRLPNRDRSSKVLKLGGGNSGPLDTFTTQARAKQRHSPSHTHGQRTPCGISFLWYGRIWYLVSWDTRARPAAHFVYEYSRSGLGVSPALSPAF